MKSFLKTAEIKFLKQLLDRKIMKNLIGFKKIYIIISIFICFFKSSYQSCHSSTNYTGTTPNIQEIFIGRCHDFLNVLRINDCDIDVSKYDCQRIWESFSSPIIGKEPCSLRMSDFDDFFQYTNHPIANNTILFWSGAYNPAQESIYI